MNESVPGLVNGSGTSTALINALNRMSKTKRNSAEGSPVKAAVKRGAHLIAGKVLPGVGNVMVDAVGKALGRGSE